MSINISCFIGNGSSSTILNELDDESEELFGVLITGDNSIWSIAF